MTRFLRDAAFTAALTVTVPVWAQVPITAEDLNRQELNRLAHAQQSGWIAPPNGFIADPVGLLVADRITSPAPRFPGLLPLVGLGVVAAGSVVNTVLLGVPTQY
jgi:hypothetical protein